MTAQLAIPGWLGAGLSEPMRVAYERAAAHVRRPNAPNTERAYEQAWVAWKNHCIAEGWDPVPIDPMQLCTYLESLELAPNTVRLRLAALCALDKAFAGSQGITDGPKLRRNLIVENWLKGWARTHPVAPRKRAPALSSAELERILATAQEPGRNVSRVSHVARYARDRALIVLGVAGALRISEACALQVADVRVEHSCLVVHVRRSKADQRGYGQRKALFPQGARLVCPVAAWQQWVRVRGEAAGPLFAPINRSGVVELGATLSVRAAERVVLDRCRAAGLEHVTSHSLRATFATLAKKRPLSAVMAHGGWRTARIALDYQRDGLLFDPDDNPTAGLLG